ncbi:MAG: outer membrane lipoprotein-sorting protein [Syntrophobacteraceae bacterium]
MRRSRIVIATMCLTCFFTLFYGRFALADVSPGDVIDNSNWQKVEGLLPQCMINHLKAGEMTLNIGTLNYSPREINEHILGGKEAIQENVGKYAIKDGVIVDAKTGGPPGFIKGLPFPNLDPKDPDLGAKFTHNRDYIRLSEGVVDSPFEFQFITPKGFEREAKGYYYRHPMDGWAPKKDTPNPDGLQIYAMYVFREPFDIAGTSMMSWRYQGTKQDQNFAYVPSIRRVRRLTPANRSDSIIGSDITYDDGWGWDGKEELMNWKVIKVGDGLMPFLDPNPQKLVKDPETGGWMTTKEFKDVIYGWKKPDAKVATWASLNVIWVKRPIYAFEAVSKDPYYNYGVQQMWFDADAPDAVLREINDRAGVFWKSYINTAAALMSDNKEFMVNTYATMQIMDNKTKRATCVEVCSSRNIWHYYNTNDINKFSLSGYAAFCK